jgi:DNA polymerase-3 subunit beta
MKLEIQFQKLKEVISLTEHVAGKHITLPVLSCIVMEVKKNTAIFKSTNLDVGVEVSIPVKSNEEGIYAIPSSILASFVSNVYDSANVVSLESTANNIQITTSKSKGVVKTLPSEDFPTIPRITDGESFSVPTNLFIKGLRAVWYSASISGVKPELSSVYVYRDGDSVVFAATDSFRLAEKKIKAGAAIKMHDILIPFKNIGDIIKILEKMGETVVVKTNKNLISFEAKDIYVVSRIIDGVFPDYRQIIPKGYATEAVLLKQDLINALKVSNIFSDKFNQIHLVIDPKKKMFEIQTKNSDIGENATTADAALSGDKMEVNFNYKYVSDCFQSIDADSVSLQLSGMNKPMVIRPVSGNQTFLYLVMPMNR